MLRPIALAVLIGLPSAALGETPPPERAPVTAEAAPSESERPPDQQPATGEVENYNVLDTTRGYVRGATEWAVRSFDSWFGEKPFEQGGRVAGRIGLSTLWRQDEGFDWLTRFAVRVRLPNLEDKGGFLFVGRDNEKEVVSDRPDTFTRRETLRQETRDDQAFFAGLGAQIADAVALRAGFRGGLKPYAQARYQNLWELGQRNQIEFKETLFWTVDDGFGSTTALNFDHVFDPSLAMRWQSAATWSQETDGVGWGSSLGLYKGFGFQRQLSLEALISGETGGDAEVSEYGIRTKWEQPIYKDWLLAEVILGYFWPRKDSVTERGRSWALGAGIQMRF
jgi:hypothetical protein